MTPAELLDKQELIKQLQDLAGRPALSPRAAELQALADDLTHGKRLDKWAELDLVHAYVRPETVTASGSRPSARRDGLLEAALGVLVFIPLLITWFGLRDAVRAYGELAEENRKEATRPFLQLWQSGFGGHLSPLGRFENVALTAVVLIALLVLLSVVHARVRWRADQEEADQEAERERLLARLASVLTRLQMLLAQHRSASPQQFATELTKAARQMNSLAAKAEKNHKELTATAGAVASATTSLQDAATKLTEEVPKLGAAANRMETTLRDVQAATVQAGAANTAAADVIAERVKAAGTTVETSLQALVTAQRELVTKSESVARATQQASQALVTSTGRTSDAMDGIREATERWDAAAAHWQDAAARVESGVRSAAGATAGAPPVRNGAARPADLYGAPQAGAYGSPDTEPYGTPLPSYDASTGPYGTPTPPPGSTNGATVPGPRAAETRAPEGSPAQARSAAPEPTPAPAPTPAPTRTPQDAPRATTPQDAPPPRPTAPVPSDTPSDAPSGTPSDATPDTASDVASNRTRALRPPTRRPSAPPSSGSDA
ncbi:hypothetical protein [Streptomyces alboflavus]|uniref:hypothetical protein n=1 Tax=Streptomyces alboflavus TaxID=67267 RepID=UPI00368548E7